MKSKFACILLLLISAIAFGQKPKQYVKLGDKARENGNWPAAYAYYEEAFLLDSTDFDLNLHYAEAARQIKSFELAERLYDKLYEKDRGRVFPDGLFWLAMMQKHNGKYEDAQRNFKKYAKKHKAKADKKLLERAEQEVKSAVWAMEYKENNELTNKIFLELASPEQLQKCRLLAAEMKTLIGPVNSEQSEIAPRIFSTQLTYSTYYSDSLSEYWMMMKSAIETGKENNSGFLVSDIKSYTDEVGLKNEANLFVFDNVAYFTRAENGISQLWSANIEKASLQEGQGKLINPHPINELNEKGFVFTMPCVAEKEGTEILLFSSNRSGGFGGMDIWASERQNDTWKKPINLGGIINTPGDELTPFYLKNHLFFSSDWHEGMGAQDVFCAKDLGNVYDKPLNLGRPFNSPQNDIYFWLDETDLIFLFSSNREGSTGSTEGVYCCNDIYGGKVEFICEKEEISELANLMSSLPVRLYFHNDEPNPDSRDTTTTLPYSSAYESYLEKIPTYLRENGKGLIGEKQEEAETITQDFFDLMVKKGMNDLQTFSDLLLKELEQGKRIRISVRGFASPRAQTDYNVNLTKRRIGSLINYLNEEKGGAFIPFINATATNGGKLEFGQLPFGEYKSDKSVSDDLFNEKQSIFSRAACLERKIEIESVSIIPAEPKAVIEMQEAFDFGKILSSQPAVHIFEIRNIGNAPLQVDSLQASCGCTTPSLDKSFILPGESAQLKAGFDPLRKKGQQVIEVYLFIHGETEPRIITIMADVE
ncbi:MAG: DUF1573 domain-containing protein [Flavobacteriales bacterium]|nr:DUF1573 domain-containing protein [Flavobacteriales bacterium]